jgi:hypothetical protein
MKEWVRWRLWDVADVFLSWGNGLQDQVVKDRISLKGKSGYEMNLYVECTEEDSVKIMEDVMGLLCQGEDDGDHHVCLNQSSLGMTRVVDDIYTEYETETD